MPIFFKTERIILLQLHLYSLREAKEINHVIYLPIILNILNIKVLTNVRLILPFLCFTDQKSYFYHSSFQILNVNYSDELNSSATQKYRTLSGKIESMVS